MKSYCLFFLCVFMSVIAKAEPFQNTGKATVNKTWIEHNVTLNGVLGMKVHAEIAIDNYLRVVIKVLTNLKRFHRLVNSTLSI